jgi:transcriptional regulator with XRE-family HTH domain
MTTKILDAPNQLLLAETLHELINRDGKLTPASLARKLGIPTNKITRILNGDVTDPKASTLLQIANCFDIKIEQLLGLEPIAKGGEYSDTVSSQLIPIYELTHFDNKSKSKDWYRWVDNDLAGSYCAISVNTDLYEPTFPKNSLLIINPDVHPEDRSFIVVTKKNNPTYCIIKKYVIDGDLIYLYPINPKLSIENNDQDLYNTLGVILEVHQKLQR